MPIMNSIKHAKRYLIIFFFIVFYSFAYTFMIALLYAEDYNHINYFFDSGISLSVIGSIALFIIYKVDSAINKITVSSSNAIVLINFFISFVTTSLLFFLISWLLNVLLKNDFSVSFSFIKEQIMLFNYLIILILTYHSIAYFTRAIARNNKVLKAENLEMNLALNKYLKRIPSILNKQTSLISVDEILYFRIEDGVLFAYLSDGKRKPLTINTLNDLTSKLNPSVFFRINRSEVINIESVVSYEPYFKERLAIKLSDNETVLYTSNTRSAYFRKWLINPSEY